LARADPLADQYWDEICTAPYPAPHHPSRDRALRIVGRILEADEGEDGVPSTSAAQLRVWCDGVQHRAVRVLAPVCAWEKAPPAEWRALMKAAVSLAPDAPPAAVRSAQTGLAKCLVGYVHDIFCAQNHNQSMKDGRFGRL